MYKYEGQTVKTRLEAHIRSHGCPPWLSVTTSPSGSYREHNVLDFLERHVPLKTTSRRWRIMMAGDNNVLHPEQVPPLEDGATAAFVIRSSKLMATYAIAMRHLQESGAVIIGGNPLGKLHDQGT